MKTQTKFASTVLCVALITNTISLSSKVEAKNVVIDRIKIEKPTNIKFSENGKPRALDLYWHRMAQCETGGNWHNGGKWSGGLGIYINTWIGYGGREFAPKPSMASVEEQIIVANRISTQGYQTKDEFISFKDKQENKPFFRPPVGFGGWGCKKHVGKPALFKKFPSKILLRQYKLGERSKYVFGIQKIIGVGVDGYFGPITDRYYNKFFSKYRSIIMAEYNKYNP